MIYRHVKPSIRHSHREYGIVKRFQEQERCLEMLCISVMLFMDIVVTNITYVLFFCQLNGLTCLYGTQRITSLFVCNKSLSFCSSVVWR